MATFATQRVINDLGSEVVAQIVTNYAALIDALGDFITTVKSAADVAAINTAATTAETALEANVKVIVTEPTIPAAPSRPSV